MPHLVRVRFRVRVGVRVRVRGGITGGTQVDQLEAPLTLAEQQVGALR